MEVAGQMIMQKVSLLNEMLRDWLQQIMDSNHSFEGLPYAGLISSFAFLQDDILFCDTVKICMGVQEILMFVIAMYFQEGDLRLVDVRLVSKCSRFQFQIHDFVRFLSDAGRCDIRVNFEIPEGTELAEFLSLTPWAHET
ncbi:hypothetical protein ACLOJK_007984 [Asimina triloba]